MQYNSLQKLYVLFYVKFRSIDKGGTTTDGSQRKSFDYMLMG